MSHITGTLQTFPTPLNIGPDAGLPTTTFHPAPPASGGLKFAILHFTNAVLPANNRLEVDLGYATDVFTSADGTDFWTRPVNVSAFTGGNIPIRYITNERQMEVYVWYRMAEVNAEQAGKIQLRYLILILF
jgi:hypothetical protein